MITASQSPSESKVCARAMRSSRASPPRAWNAAAFSPAANANALRWGTMYNYRFDCDIAPTTGTVTLGLFKAGSPASVAVADIPVPGAFCYANCDASTTAPCLNVQDFSCFLNSFAVGETYANCDASTTIPVLNVQDFSCFLNAYAASCSNC